MADQTDNGKDTLRLQDAVFRLKELFLTLKQKDTAEGNFLDFDIREADHS